MAPQKLADMHSRCGASAHPGTRASRPQRTWHSLSHLRHLYPTETAPWLSFGLADSVSADVAAIWKVMLELCGRDARAPAGSARQARIIY